MKIFEYLQKIHTLPSKKMTIVDLGCGDGRVLKPFYDNGYTVFGVDTNTDDVLIARAAMPRGFFSVDDIRHTPIPENSFVILRNVLPFLNSKEEVMQLLKKCESRPVYFSLFGPEDEKALAALTWTREEVSEICGLVGGKIIEEQNGMSTTLKGKPRRTHIYHVVRD